MSSFIYFLRESFTGFARHLSTTLGSIITIFLSLLIIGVFALSAVVVNNVVSSVESEVSITAYLADGITDAQLSTAQTYIEGLPDVKSVSYTSKEQALQNFKNSVSSSMDYVEQMGDQNPIPASFTIELNTPDQVQNVVDTLAASSQFRAVADVPDDPASSLMYGAKTVEKLFQLTSAIRYIGVAVIALLIFIALVFINNTIRLAIMARRKEISIMRLVGASNGFIRGPFLMEAILHALIGTALAVGVLEVLRRFALPQLSSVLAWLPLNLPTLTVIIVYVCLLVAGLLIGLTGSAFAMRRYLKA
ncbi:MAG: permease-like cell division protein FtsX [Coriobacteriia bacterium]|nr:permease-like cell division protein FtsX [Coriobacteriia bacterium]